MGDFFSHSAQRHSQQSQQPLQKETRVMIMHTRTHTHTHIHIHIHIHIHTNTGISSDDRWKEKVQVSIVARAVNPTCQSARVTGN